MSLPTYVIIEEMPDSLTSNLDTMGMRSSTEGLMVPIGSPRYVKGMDSFLQTKTVASSLAFSSLRLIGTNADLL